MWTYKDFDSFFVALNVTPGSKNNLQEDRDIRHAVMFSVFNWTQNVDSVQLQRDLLTKKT